jgi:hypothetical protein
MKSDLSNVQIGDVIWQKHIVDNVIPAAAYPINCRSAIFTFDGKLDVNDKFPSAFLTNPFEKEEWVERVMEVSDDGKEWKKRVVSEKLKKGFLAYHVKSIENVTLETFMYYWNYAREVQSEPQSVEMTIAEIEQALGKKIKIKG